MPPESTPNPSYSLRDARTDEAAAVGGVISAAYAQFQPAYPPESWERFFRMVGEVGGHFEHAQVIVAEQDGAIVGTVTFYPMAPSRGKESGRKAGQAYCGWRCCHRIGVTASRGR